MSSQRKQLARSIGILFTAHIFAATAYAQVPFSSSSGSTATTTQSNPQTAPTSPLVCDNSTTIYQIAGFCVENKVNISVAITVVLFFLGYLIARWFEKRNRLRNRRIYLLALLQEVKLNVDSIDQAIRAYPSVPDLNKFLRTERPDNMVPRPFITFNYFSTVFRTRTDVLQDLDEGLVGNIIEFYGRLDGLAIDVAALDKKAFETISLDGREGIMADIKSELEICQVIGKSVDSGVKLYLKLT